MPAQGAARSEEEGQVRVNASVDSAPRSGGGGAIAEYFKFAERGTNMATEIRGGLTTFMVMVYIIFVNAGILGAGFQLDPAGIAAVSAATALIAGIMTIAMGVIGNYPFALAAGLGINAIVAFGLDRTRALSPEGAMGVIVLEGLVVTALVLVGFREAVMNAVPLSLKRAIGAGIGLFILFIGFFNGGIIASTGNTSATGPALAPVFPTMPSHLRLPVRAADHGDPLGASREGPRLDASRHPRHDGPRTRRGRRDGAGRTVGDSELHAGRRVRPHERLHRARRS